jgi:hypothetical protein
MDCKEKETVNKIQTDVAGRLEKWLINRRRKKKWSQK